MTESRLDTRKVQYPRRDGVGGTSTPSKKANVSTSRPSSPQELVNGNAVLAAALQKKIARKRKIPTPSAEPEPPPPPPPPPVVSTCLCFSFIYLFYLTYIRVFIFIYFFFLPSQLFLFKPALAKILCQKIELLYI